MNEISHNADVTNKFNNPPPQPQPQKKPTKTRIKNKVYTSIILNEEY